MVTEPITALLTIMKMATTAIALAKATGLIQDRISGVENLARSSLESGRLLLDAASRAPTHRVESLVQEAVPELMKAVSLEHEAHRKALAWFTLSVCHQVLGDEANRTVAFDELLRVEATRSPWVAFKTKSTTLSFGAIGRLIDPQGARLEAFERALINDPGLLNLRILQCAVADHVGARLDHGKAWSLGELAWRDTLERVARRRPELVVL